MVFWGVQPSISYYVLHELFIVLWIHKNNTRCRYYNESRDMREIMRVKNSWADVTI